MLQEIKEKEQSSTYNIDHPDVTTNLFVTNIDPSMNEDTLKSIFDRFGKVNRYVASLFYNALTHLLTVFSAKIMWPRNDEERKKTRNCGFVSFQEKKDALSAMNLAQSTGGLLHNRTKLAVQWGRVPNPQHMPSSASTDVTGTVKRPEDPKQKRVIDLLAKYVAKNGEAFEKVLSSGLCGRAPLSASTSDDEYASTDDTYGLKPRYIYLIMWNH